MWNYTEILQAVKCDKIQDVGHHADYQTSLTFDFRCLIYSITNEEILIADLSKDLFCYELKMFELVTKYC